ncbi:TadE/TadG family type IV pilus assembly protein [Ornithinicoccus halotolerans]|uniref:TadE/TadG family type IV pilus assembly protein n=1 Tax=Ornithinicoccus halotolerans TaxID=1748220 RepID=UPI00129630C4|nr:TadE family protein [Ornithinicoccus halotolerans]
MEQHAQERGAAAVEFALVVLMLLTLVFGGLEFGRLWMMQSSLSQAARDAARELAIKKDSADVQARLDEVFIFGSPTYTQTACPASSDPTVVDSAQVVASFEASFMTGFFGDGLTLTGEGIMRCGG